jgi:uncharacterized protein involved in exopolysaccharide biosynthesis
MFAPAPVALARRQRQGVDVEARGSWLRSLAARFWPILVRLPRLLFRTTRKSWALVLATTAVAVVGAAVYVIEQPVIYRSTASLLIDPLPPRRGGDARRYYRSEQEYLEAQAKMLTSRHLASLTVLRLGLQADPSFVGHQTGAVEALQGKVDAKLVEGTRLITVSLDDTNPDRTQRLLGGLVETFVRQNPAERASGTSSSDRLRQERNSLSVSFADQASMFEDELAEVTQSLTEARVRGEELASRLGELTKLDVDDREALPAGRLLASSPLLARLCREFVGARRARDSLLASGRGPNHPDVLAAESRVTSTRRALLDELGSLRTGAKLDLDLVTRHIDGLNGLYEAVKHRAFDLKELELEYQRLERVMDHGASPIRVLDAPLAGVRVEPNVPGTLAVGLLLGLAVGWVAAFGRLLFGRTRAKIWKTGSVCRSSVTCPTRAAGELCRSSRPA